MRALGDTRKRNRAADAEGAAAEAKKREKGDAAAEADRLKHQLQAQYAAAVKLHDSIIVKPSELVASRDWCSQKKQVCKSSPPPSPLFELAISVTGLPGRNVP